ncbi:hypothetical protein [Embleya sp. NPDC005575]|uniref:hypothetical protein n=1 Tax=Embleya sp. NPDC005575 TaxID=3156892 RepID=UPI0033B87B5B
MSAIDPGEECRHRAARRPHRRPAIERRGALYDEVSGYPGGEPPSTAGPGAPAIPLGIRFGGEVLSFVSTVATFGTAVDITVAEISIESFYPADKRTGQILRELHGD